MLIVKIFIREWQGDENVAEYLELRKVPGGYQIELNAYGGGGRLAHKVLYTGELYSKL